MFFFLYVCCIYNLHPIWGCLLNPTGGIVGPGNAHVIKDKFKTPIGIHACIHDAGGYLLTYHNLGPGYNYLENYVDLPTTNPFSGQRILFWWNEIFQELQPF